MKSKLDGPRKLLRLVFHNGWRIQFSLLLVLIVASAILIYAKTSLDRVVREKQDLVDRFVNQLSTVDEIRVHAEQESELAQLLVLTGERQYWDLLVQRREQVAELFRDLKAHLSRQADQASLAQIESIYLAHNTLGDRGLRLRLRGGSLSEVHRFMHEKTRAAMEKQHDLLDDLHASLAARLSEATAASTVHAAQIVKWLSIWCGLGFVLFTLVTLLISLALKQTRRLEEEQAQVLEKTKQLAKSRKEIVAVVSHDLKNPLTTIKISLELALRAREALPDKMGRHLAVALQAAESMQRLISDLLDQSKLDSHRLVLDRAPASATEFLENLLPRFRMQAKDKQIQLRTKVDPDLWGSLDPARFEQVLSNLVANAIKFTPAGGTIELKAERNARQLHFVIRDTGRGIAARDLPRIFDRFWQSPESASQGSGLGLAIAKAIVEAHDGQISVESEPGVGTSFHIFVPSLASFAVEGNA